MDLAKAGKLICDLRKAKGMTQKELADVLGIVPKTVSKWETGHGFCDVSILPALAEALGVSESVLLSGSLTRNAKEAGNMKRTKFYLCPECGSIVQGAGEYQVVCCGKPLEKLTAKPADDEHMIKITDMDGEFYLEINHTMTKEHYISFVSYVGYDRVLTVRLYPEQDSAVRFPRMFGGRFYYCCSRDGLFEYKHSRTPRNTK